MAKAQTTGARTLKLLRDRGWMAAMVERWNPYVKIRQDLFGLFDIIALGPRDVVPGFGRNIWGVQCTSNDSVAKHIEKMRRSPNYSEWLNRGGRILVVGWAKKGARGERKLWTPREIELTLAEYPPLEEDAGQEHTEEVAQGDLLEGQEVSGVAGEAPRYTKPFRLPTDGEVGR